MNNKPILYRYFDKRAAVMAAPGCEISNHFLRELKNILEYLK